MSKGLLIVSFGTSFHEAFKRDILPVEDALAKAFPDREMRRAFGSGMIIRKLKNRDNISIDTVDEALARLYKDGFSDILIQPTYFIPGIEYDNLMASIDAVRSKFEKIRVGKPLLGCPSDYCELAKKLGSIFPKGNGTVLMMGHGTSHEANEAYFTLQNHLNEESNEHILIGTVEGEPEFDTMHAELKAAGETHVTLAPLMLVAGDHATNDMASAEEDSWKSLLEADGISATAIIRGLGSYPSIQELYIAHALEAI